MRSDNYSFTDFILVN